MPQFEIEVQRNLVQNGIVTVDADSLVDAKELAEEVDADTIDWESPEVAPFARIKATWGRQT